MDLKNTYTATAVRKVINDFKKLLYTIDVTTQLLYLGYLAFALLSGSGVFIANVALAALSLAYFVFFLCVTKFGKSPDGTSAKKTVALVFKNTKRLIKLYTLGIAVYGVFTTVGDTLNPLSLLLCCFMIVGWVLSLVFDIVIKIFESRFGLVGEAIQADVDTLFKPARSVGNFFKKMTGQEVEPEREPTKNILMLDKKIEENKELERLQKQQKKQEQLEKQKRTKSLEEPIAPPPSKKELRALLKAEKQAKIAAKKAEKQTKRKGVNHGTNDSDR